MELLNKKIRYILSAVMLFGTLGFSHSALADVKQCIKNSSGVSLNVKWKDVGGNLSKDASNANLTTGMTACKRSSNKLGYALVSCNGCGLAQEFSQAAIGISGGALIGACVAMSAGACIAAAPEIAYAVAEAIMAIPNSDWKSRTVVPKDGQTIEFYGTAFDLKLR
jgi:hypothetical protein